MTLKIFSNKKTRNIIGIIAIISSYLFAMHSLDFKFNLEQIAISFAFVFVSISVATFTHELGHYYAAKYFSVKPLYLASGSTAPLLRNFNSLFTFEISGTKFSINPFSTTGLLDSDSYFKNLTDRQIKIICFAGPMINFVLFLISSLFFLSLEDFSNTYLVLFLFAFIMVNFVCFARNLIPTKLSDGWFINEADKEIKDALFYGDIDSTKEKIINIVSAKYYVNNLRELVEIEK